MIYPSRVTHSRPRNFSTPILKPTERLIFPGKEIDWDYVGKKQFKNEKFDKVILESLGSSIPIKRDNLNIADIEGARPRIRTEVFTNVSKHEKEKKYEKYENHEIKSIDSLDKLIGLSSGSQPVPQMPVLIKNKAEEFKSHSQMSENKEIERYLLKRNLEFNKRNILGMQAEEGDKEHHINKVGIKRTFVNPTFLSNMQILS